MEKGQVIFHGEVMVFASCLPNGAKRIDTGEYHIVAPSETSGNHHVIDCPEGVEFYEKDGVLYLKNEVPTQVRCLVKERHDNITIYPGVWEIGKQQEYDYFEQAHRAIRD